MTSFPRGVRSKNDLAKCVLPCLRLFFGVVLPTLAFPTSSFSQPVVTLVSEFDARELTGSEKRILQVGLAATGHYKGLIDGKWGQLSQSSFENFARDGGQYDGHIYNYHMSVLGDLATEFINDYGLRYRNRSRGAHLILVPRGDFLQDPATPIDDWVLVSYGIEVRHIFSDIYTVAELHKTILSNIPEHEAPYTVRNARRWVTSTTQGHRRFYLRTDYLEETTEVLTTIVRDMGGGDPSLFTTIVGSISTDDSADLLIAGGLLERVVLQGRAIVGSAPPGYELPPPQSTQEPPTIPPQPSGDGVGTGFFVNNTDLVTAYHVIEGCEVVTLLDGTVLRMVDGRPDLDLAVLTSPVRSRNWVPIGQSGGVRLGQKILAIGYPFFGQFGSSLTVTGGNVSALAGMFDDSDRLTISAPVQPGNSGGPLLNQGGAAIGVVVSRLNELRVAEITGSIPQNINYAVTGTALIEFLKDSGIGLPRLEVVEFDLDEGIPDTIASAVVPLLCGR